MTRVAAMVVATTLILGFAAACDSQTDSSRELDKNERGVIARMYVDAWPLTVNGGTLRCDEPNLVTFTTDDGKRWALNGPARVNGKRGWIDDIGPIWKDARVAGTKVDIAPLIDDGLTLCTSTVSSRGPDQNERAIIASVYGEAWPLTVNGGTLRCDKRNLVTFTTEDGKRWALNGPARVYGKRGWIDDIGPIWKDARVAGTKVDIAPLIDKGLTLCKP
jgi:hypothetical protein